MNFFKRAVSGTVLSAVALMSVGTLTDEISKDFVSLNAEAAVTVNNPVIWSDVPDCDVIRVGDTYYMVSTTMFFSPGAPIMKSKDLVTWEICSYVYDTLADGDVQNLTNGKHDYAHGQWAASLRYNKGRFYVFFGSYGTGKSYIYSTDDIENGEWSRVELNGMYHDASMFFDSDGRNYLVYGGGGEIKIKEFNSDMTGFKQGGADKTLFKTGLDNLAGEGSHIQKIGDYYYVFVIAWPSTSGRIELCYRSKDILGTYEGKTVLNSGLGTYGAGVAQGGIVDTPDGKWYGMLFQDHGSVGRIPVLVPVTWENGWPMMGVSGKAPLTITVDGDSTGTSLAGDDDFSYNSNDLALEWQWNHNPDNKSWSVTERDGWLRLHNNTLATNILNARNTLTMRTEGPACSSCIKLDTKGMKVGDYAGLSAFQLNFGNIGVYVTDSGQKKIYMAKNGGSEVASSSNKIIAETNMSGDEIFLKVDFKFANVGSDGSSSYNIDKANFYYSYDGESWTKLGEELSMTYDLKLFTGYRSAIYSYPTKSTGGYADIDFFEYERTAWNGSDGSYIVNQGGSGSSHIIEPDENGYYFHSTFEGSSESWEGRGAATVTTSGRTAYEGKEALLVQDRTASWNGVTRKLNSAFKAGEEYSFSTNVMYFDGEPSQLFYLTLQYQGADGEVHYDKVAKGTAIKGEWIQLANTNFKIPEGATDLNLYVETDEGTSNFYIDDSIGAVAGTVIKGAGVAPVITPGDVNCDGIIDEFDVASARYGLVKGFSSSYTQFGADVDQSGEYEINDLVLLEEYVIGKINEFPVYTPPEPEKVPFNYNSSVSFKTAPNDYLNPVSTGSKIVKETYTGINGQKSLNVYLPAGYDSSKKYNIFYLMHGGGENENTIFSDDVKFGNMLDHMIENGDIEPMIVVTPTFNGGNCSAYNVHEEIRQSIVPFVESKYSTYAEDTTPSGLEASRMHRAYGGFSMGGGTTWNVLINSNDYFAYFMPLSGHCWGGAEEVTKAVSNSKYKDSIYILAATGTQDIAYDNLKGLINSLKTQSVFKYTSDFSKGNLYFIEAADQTHWWGVVRHYVYDALPYFFHE